VREKKERTGEKGELGSVDEGAMARARERESKTNGSRVRERRGEQDERDESVESGEERKVAESGNARRRKRAW